MSPPGFLIPVKRFVSARGVFRWPARPLLVGAEEADVTPLAQLAADAARLAGAGGSSNGAEVRVARTRAAGAALTLVRDKSIKGDEAYRLRIDGSGGEVRSSAAAGAYYAVQTLRELVTVHGRELPNCLIEDSPDFARRGVYHDCSRGKVPKLSTLKGMVEWLARWKINELQLYIENVFTFKRHPLIGRGYSPLTPEEILALQEHCKQHHVRLVPSLASFGHMEKILALPAYRRLGELPGYRGWAGGTTLCPVDPGSIRLVGDLYSEFLPLFDATDFNVCGDEPWELGQGRSKFRSERVGKGRLYLDFMKKVHAICIRHGKRMNAWADIVLEHPELLSEWPEDIVMLNWDYQPAGGRIPRTKEIVDAGLPIMVCPGTNAWNSHGCRLLMGMENISSFAGEGIACRAEGLLNTDWGDGGHRNSLAISLHNFAWGAAQSWNHQGADDQEVKANFTELFCRHVFGGRIGSSRAGGARARRFTPAVERLAGSIRTLGGIHEALKVPYGNGIFTYSILMPLSGPRPAFSRWDNQQFHPVTAADMESHLERLSKIGWPAPETGMETFLSDTLEEYSLASALDVLALRRALVLKRLRQFRLPLRSDLKRIVDEASALIPEFARVWMLRNKPSRLRDNIAGLRKMLSECRAL